MNSNITTPLLSFVPMLKKSLRIFCYMGLFFVASTSYAADSYNFRNYAEDYFSFYPASPWVRTEGVDNKQKISSNVSYYNTKGLIEINGSGELQMYATTSVDYQSSDFVIRSNISLSSTTLSGVSFFVGLYSSTNIGIDYAEFCSIQINDTVGYPGVDNTFKVSVPHYVSPTISRDSDILINNHLSELYGHNILLELFISYTNGTCIGKLTSDNFSTSTPVLYFDKSRVNTTKTLVVELNGIDSTTDRFIHLHSLDLVSYYSPDTNYTSPCSTCTRIISHTPDRGETFATTQDIPIYSEVYVASSDVINQSNIYTKFYWTSIKAPAEFSGIGIGENDPQPSGTHKEQILIFDEPYQTFPHLVDFDFATGTYKMKIQILEEIQPPWWQFWNDYIEEKELASTEYEFYILQPTDYEEMIQLSQQVIAQQEAMALANDCAREGFVSQACFLSYGSELINSIKYAPPHGYAFLLVDKLMATTTGTSSISMLVSFPEGSPLRGHTLDLNMSSAIGNSISYIDAQDIETLPDGAMNTFMKYWNYLCYIMLGLWILREIFGTFSFDFSYGGGKYQRSGNVIGTNKSRAQGNIPVVGMSSNTTNYRKSGRSLNIKSYD